jgi:hypothetical protein
MDPEREAQEQRNIIDAVNAAIRKVEEQSEIKIQGSNEEKQQQIFEVNNERLDINHQQGKVKAAAEEQLRRANYEETMEEYPQLKTDEEKQADWKHKTPEDKIKMMISGNYNVPKMTNEERVRTLVELAKYISITVVKTNLNIKEYNLMADSSLSGGDMQDKELQEKIVKNQKEKENLNKVKKQLLSMIHKIEGFNEDHEKCVAEHSFQSIDPAADTTIRAAYEQKRDAAKIVSVSKEAKMFLGLPDESVSVADA